MPPRTKSKVVKVSKENLGTESKSTVHTKVSKPARKVLADKTNSLSDNNASSVEVIKKAQKVSTKVTVVEKNGRPHRERRVPTRYVGNRVLNHVTDSKASTIPSAESTTTNQNNVTKKKLTQAKQPSRTKHPNDSNQQNNQTIEKKKSPQASGTLGSSDSLWKCNKSTHSSFKTPTKIETCVVNRPKRIHRLPSRFEDHSMSPSKFVPILPSFASTPLQKQSKQNINEKNKHIKKSNSSNKSSPDTNNNPRKTRAAKQKVDFKQFFSPPHAALKSKDPAPIVVRVNRILNKSQSFKVLEKKQTKENNGVDVYEFTYDPNEEPTQKKKKRKRVVKKNPVKPKFVTFKSNYEQNLSRTLNSLKKKVVSRNPTTTLSNKIYPSCNNQDNKIEKSSAKQVQPKNNLIEKTKQCCPANSALKESNEQTNLGAPCLIESNNPEGNVIPIPHPKILVTKSQKTIDTASDTTVANAKNPDNDNKFASIRIEDIAADFELSDNYDDINYSPINSPIRPVTPNNIFITENINTQSEQKNETLDRTVNSHDPLNLQDNISFFKEHPAASSSINMSVKHPLASPWRVEFENLPIKWQVNTYVKPNMTPAVESSFISSKDDNKKKHVYTNMLLPSNEMLLERSDVNTSHLKQTSIISFMKEVAEKSANKKKRALSVTPTKANSLFEDMTGVSVLRSKDNLQDIDPKDSNVLIQNKKAANDKENIRDKRKRKNEDNIEIVPAKSPRRQKNKDYTYFGFDDSENQDNENVSPKKINCKVRALRPRARAVLQEINGQVGPTRANLPLAAKSKVITSSEAVNKMYENMKSAEVAPTFEDRNNIQKHSEATTIDPILGDNDDNADSNSVHLFEDIELVHHLKPTRKSYAKAKKVTFRQHSVSDEDSRNSYGAHHSELSDVEDLGDLTFTMPVISKKKPTRKKKPKSQLSNKEKKEADAWAASFNSMCDDIEEFPLVVE